MPRLSSPLPRASARLTATATAVLLVAGCAQFTTSDADRARLQAAADTAGQAYLDCLDQQATRYVGTTGDARGVFSVARSNCAGARDAAGRAQSELQETNYIMASPQVEASLAALDARGEAAVTEKVLAAGAPPAVPAPPPAAVAAGGSYLDCMRDQATRWASVAEPAAVIADAAHGRCAGRLAGAGDRAAMEAEGRALATGIVLDRKAAAP